jgi:hypothetical protein
MILKKCHKFFRRRLGKDKKHIDCSLDASAAFPITVPTHLLPELYNCQSVGQSLDPEFAFKIELSDRNIHQAASEDPLLIVVDIVSRIPGVLQDYLYEVATVTASIRAEDQAIEFLHKLIENFVSAGVKSAIDRTFLEQCRINIEHLKTRRNFLEAIKKAVNDAHRRMTALCLKGAFNTRVEALDQAEEVDYVGRVTTKRTSGELSGLQNDLLSVLRPRITCRLSAMTEQVDQAESNMLKTECVFWGFVKQYDVPVEY